MDTCWGYACYACESVVIYEFGNVSKHLCVCVYVRASVFAFKCACMFVWCMCMYVCMYVCMVRARVCVFSDI